MPDQLFVIVPSLTPTGPVKGAAALCNALVDQLPVTLVALKAADGKPPPIDPRVNRLPVHEHRNWGTKRAELARALHMAGGRSRVASVSMCLSADAVNFWMRRHAVIASSVRGNLPMNYRFDFGRTGTLVAGLHLFALRRFDAVTAMSDSMQAQLHRFGLRRVHVIGNFIDELSLEPLRIEPEPLSDTLRLVFVGSLSTRKRPQLLLEAAAALNGKGRALRMDIVGGGPLDADLRRQAEARGLAGVVHFHGQIDEPYEILQRADCLVLPSESEGISRAVMEALYFGVPCILRDVDGNRELISSGVNGELFQTDADLVGTIDRFHSRRNGYRPRRVLLPDQFRQRRNAEKLLELLQQ